MTGDRIVAASWAGTGVFAATAALAAAVPDADVAALAVALVLFLAGTVVFVVALVRAAGRSRTEEVHLAGLFYLGGAPARPRWHLLGSLAVEVVVAFATAGVRPNTSLAFGLLAPVYGQALAGLWGAVHGVFPARAAAPRDPPRRRPPGAPPSRQAPSKG